MSGFKPHSIRRLTLLPIAAGFIGLGCLAAANAAPGGSTSSAHGQRDEHNVHLRLQRLEAAVLALQSDTGRNVPSDLSQRLTAVESALAQLRQSVPTDIDGRITALESAVNQLQAGLPSDLEQRLRMLESNVGELQALSVPMDADVNCAAGNTISAVLATHASGAAPLTIRISGTCNEAVVIGRGNVTLIGQLGAAVQAPAAAYAVSVTNGAANVSVSGLTLLGGAGAASVSRGAHAEFSNIVSAGGVGMVSQDNGTMDITGSVMRNSTWGAYALRGGIINISNSTIESNSYGAYAVGGRISLSNRLPNGSAAPAGVLVRQNDKGSVARAGGVIEVSSSRIESNATDGIFVRRASSVVFWDSGNEITNNGGYGVLCDVDTSYTLTGTSLGIVSSNHGGGIHFNCRQ